MAIGAGLTVPILGGHDVNQIPMYEYICQLSADHNSAGAYLMILTASLLAM